jgi:hypothetical protein
MLQETTAGPFRLFRLYGTRGVSGPTETFFYVGLRLAVSGARYRWGMPVIKVGFTLLFGTKDPQ